MACRLALLAGLACWPGTVLADFDDALKAYESGNDAAALRKLLDARSAPPGQAGQSGPGTPAQAPQALNPFALFSQGAASAAATSTDTATHEAPAGLDQTLSQMAQRLLVGDGSSGRRGVQIQLSRRRSWRARKFC